MMRAARRSARRQLSRERWTGQMGLKRMAMEEARRVRHSEPRRQKREAAKMPKAQTAIFIGRKKAIGGWHMAIMSKMAAAKEMRLSRRR